MVFVLLLICRHIYPWALVYNSQTKITLTFSFLVVPPEFTRKPADQTVTEGNKVTFHCAANGDPAPEIKWVNGETTLALGGTLTFEASRNHSGTYLCVAENGLDEEVKTSAYLDVLCEYLKILQLSE